MSIPIPSTLLEAFGVNASSPYIRSIPTTTSTPGAASLDQGFPAATMMLPSAGGVPVAGPDVNGILNLLSQHTAWINSGGQYQWDAALIAGPAAGYPVNAIVQSSVTASKYYLNTVANNANNPDVTITGWIAFSILASPTAQATIVLASGAINNLVIGAGIGFVDFNPTTGNSNVTGFVAGVDGQVVTFSNIHASNTVTINSLNAGSSAANRVRYHSDPVLAQYNSVTLRYSSTLALWIPNTN